MAAVGDDGRTALRLGTVTPQDAGVADARASRACTAA
jgi:hypothetical protein